MTCSVYSGLVPMSPYTTPSAPSASTAFLACAMTSRSESSSAAKRLRMASDSAARACLEAGEAWSPSLWADSLKLRSSAGRLPDLTSSSGSTGASTSAVWAASLRLRLRCLGPVSLTTASSSYARHRTLAARVVMGSAWRLAGRG